MIYTASGAPGLLCLLEKSTSLPPFGVFLFDTRTCQVHGLVVLEAVNSPVPPDPRAKLKVESYRILPLSESVPNVTPDRPGPAPVDFEDHIRSPLDHISVSPAECVHEELQLLRAGFHFFFLLPLRH